ncbi:MAG: Fe-S cluster assembly protein SufD [Bacteroidetes bacterium]|nr:Fe-S cluster assembly protein SufD [Bacteroidota bacterium]
METITKTSLKDKLIGQYELAKPSFVGDAAIREMAINAFAEQGLPGRKHEEYKYLNFELILKGDYSFSHSPSLAAQQIQTLYLLKDAYVAVFVNGQFNSNLSKLNDLPKGLIICSLPEAFEKHKTIVEQHYAKHADVNADNFIALNTALASDGCFVHVAKGAIIDKPIHLLYISSANENLILNTRNLVVVEENAQVKIVESFEVKDLTSKVVTNASSEIVVMSNAIVDHYKIQNESEQSVLVNTTQVYQEKQSVFSTVNFTLNGGVVRNNLNIVLGGEYIESHLNGLYLTKNNQQVDNHTLVDHRMPNCNSNELYKGIIDDKSVATFNGKIYVRKDAQKTNAFQSNKNILLSDDGTINTKPQLEIYADDVKCSHGTSTGKLDEDQVFYLRARGLSEASAKKLLMHAFASEVVGTVKIDELKEYLEAEISARFE